MSTSEIETQARAMGWLPKERFIEQGRPEKNWVDAETYVERGEQIVPILKANNKHLVGQVTELQRQNAEFKTQLDSATEAIDALKDLRSSLTVDKVKQEKAGLLEQIKEAKTSGDVDAEVALTDKLSEVNTALREAAKPPVKVTKVEPTGPQLTAEAQAWQEQNPWFGSTEEADAGKTGYAMGLAQAWVRSGKKTGTKEFFDHVDKKMGEVFDENRSRRESGSKVNETTNSESGDGGTSGHSFADLPRDAKEAFEKNAKILVGPSKLYKTRKELQDVYIAQYDWS